MTDGFRESTQSWREVLLDLKRRGLKQDPKLAIGDGALGFWAALREVFPTTREQRCWLHKTMNVLNAMPKSVQAKAKAPPARHLAGRHEGRSQRRLRLLRQGLRREMGQGGRQAGQGPGRAADLLRLPRGTLEAHPHVQPDREHVRHREDIARRRTKGCLSRKTGLAMAFRLMMSAQKKWRKLGRSKPACRRSSAGLSSATVSVTFKLPPDHASPTSAHISCVTLGDRTVGIG